MLVHPVSVFDILWSASIGFEKYESAIGGFHYRYMLLRQVFSSNSSTCSICGFFFWVRYLSVFGRYFLKCWYPLYLQCLYLEGTFNLKIPNFGIIGIFGIGPALVLGDQRIPIELQWQYICWWVCAHTDITENFQHYIYITVLAGSN